MLTPKMHKIANDIGQIIYEHYDQNYLEKLFSFGISVEEIIIQVLVICCRNAYLVNSEKHPLSYYIKQENHEFDLARKEHERILKYIKVKDRLLNDCIEQNIGDRFPSPELEFVQKNNQFSGYAFSAFQYWENKNIHDMKLVKSIVERRIVNSNSVTNSDFITLSKEYDDAVSAMKSLFGRDPESTVFSSLQFFTLQTKYSFDFFYELAVQMEKLRIKKFPDMHNRLMTVSGSYKCESPLPDICPNSAHDVDRKIEYPLIIQRQRVIDQIVSEPEGGAFDLKMSAFIEANVLANAVRSHMHIGGLRLPLCVAQETKIEDWASVFDIYNVFQTFVPQKEWTGARIKSVRNMYDMLSIDYKSLKYQENRP